MQVTFNLDQLRAVLLGAAKSDIRYYLNGVYVESNGGTTRMVSTNGHHLLAVDYRHGNKEDWCGNFILPRDVCELVCKGKYYIGFGTIEIEGEFNPGTTPPRITGTVRVCDTAIGFKAVEGHFPDYCRVITPWEGNDTNMKAGHYNPDYIALFAKIAKVLGSKKGFYTLWQRGEDVALINFDVLPENVNAVGVLMAMREKSIYLNVPCTTQFRTKLTVEVAGIAQTKDVEPDSAQVIELRR